MAKAKRKPVNIALQGGGAHGAFTWGVLDALLEDGRLAIEGLSGTSAGAMNAVAFAEGFARDGAAGARSCLRRFWEGVAHSSRLGPTANAPWSTFFDPFNLYKQASAAWMSTFLRNTSPYDVNPLNLNPLRDVVDELIDFEAVRACDKLKLFVTATNVETGRTRIFKRDELTADHVMASACLPFVFQAVTIDGTPYWDGGYVGNPALWPLFYETDASDVIVVQINPIERPGEPKSIQDILDRMTEITFNSSLLREYRMIEFVSRLIGEGRLDEDHYKNVFVHRIDGGAALMDLSATTRLTADAALFEDLFTRGRDTAQAWLGDYFDALGARSSLDLRRLVNNPDVGV